MHSSSPAEALCGGGDSSPPAVASCEGGDSSLPVHGHLRAAKVMAKAGIRDSWIRLRPSSTCRVFGQAPGRLTRRCLSEMLDIVALPLLANHFRVLKNCRLNGTAGGRCRVWVIQFNSKSGNVGWPFFHHHKMARKWPLLYTKGSQVAFILAKRT